MRRLCLAVVAAALGAGAAAPAAHAACAAQPLDARMASATAAFEGTVVAREPLDPEQPFGAARYTFRVLETFKGTLGPEAVVYSDGSSEGLNMRVGQTAGLLGRPSNRGGLDSGACWVLTEQDLAALRDRTGPVVRSLRVERRPGGMLMRVRFDEPATLRVLAAGLRIRAAGSAKTDWIVSFQRVRAKRLRVAVLATDVRGNRSTTRRTLLVRER